MKQHAPLTAHRDNAKPSPMLINSNASRECIATAADLRLSAARDLLDTIAMAADGAAGGLGGPDVHSVAWAAHLLVSDGIDLFSAYRDASPHAPSSTTPVQQAGRL